MNHTVPVPAFAVVSVGAVFDRALPGTYVIKDAATHIYCECPCGCGSHMRLPIHREGAQPIETPSWMWNGSRDQPTLTPSIRDMRGCHFHGHLTNGVWAFEGDSGVGA